MISISKQQLLDFINNQPDDRQVNFSENSSRDSCGCLMVHMAKDLGYDNFTCGLNGVYSTVNGNREQVLKFDNTHSIIFDMMFLSKSERPKTYKEVKVLINNLTN